MCTTDSDITPTRQHVYLRKTTRAKEVKARAVTRLVVRDGSSSDEDSSEECTQRSSKYVFRCGSSSEVQKKGKCTCGGDCDTDSCETKLLSRCPSKEKRKKRKKKGFLRIMKKCCHCNGGNSDGWLCDVCRAQEKKKGVWRFVSRGSDSDCNCNSCDSSSECDCGNTDRRFKKECDAWMKAAAKKRKEEQKQEMRCNCHRPGCKVCVIVNC